MKVVHPARKNYGTAASKTPEATIAPASSKRATGEEAPITPPGGQSGNYEDIGNPNQDGSPQPTLVDRDHTVVQAPSQGAYLYGHTTKPGSDAERLNVSPSTMRARTLTQGLTSLRQRYGFNSISGDGLRGYRASNPEVQKGLDEVMSNADNVFNQNSVQTAQWLTHDTRGNAFLGQTFTQGAAAQDMVNDRIKVGEESVMSDSLQDAADQSGPPEALRR